MDIRDRIGDALIEAGYSEEIQVFCMHKINHALNLADIGHGLGRMLTRKERQFAHAGLEQGKTVADLIAKLSG